MASVDHLLVIASQCLQGAPLSFLSTIALSHPCGTSLLLSACLLHSRKTPFCAQSIHLPSLSWELMSRGCCLFGAAVTVPTEIICDHHRHDPQKVTHSLRLGL